MNAIITAVVLVVCAGFIASLLLVIASHAFYVPVDERVSEVREILPGANCGGCDSLDVMTTQTQYSRWSFLC